MNKRTIAEAKIRCLAIMNLAIRGIEADFGGPEHADIHHLAPHSIPAEARATIRNDRIVRFERIRL